MNKVWVRRGLDNYQRGWITRCSPHDVGAESAAGPDRGTDALAPGTIGHPEQRAVAGFLLRAGTGKQHAVRPIQHRFAESQCLDQHTRRLQALAHRFRYLFRYVAKRLYLVHRLVQAGLELLREILLVLVRVHRFVIRDREQFGEELDEPFLKHVAREGLLQRVRRVARRHVINHRLVQRLYRRPAQHRHRPVHLIEQRQRFVLRLSREHRHRLCNNNKNTHGRD